MRGEPGTSPQVSGESAHLSQLVIFSFWRKAMTTFLFSLERCGSGTPGVCPLENYSGFMTNKASVDDADTGGSSAQLH